MGNPGIVYLITVALITWKNVFESHETIDESHIVSEKFKSAPILKEAFLVSNTVCLHVNAPGVNY